MKNLKYIAGVVVALVWIIAAYFAFIVPSTNANPDYICIKNVENTCTFNESTDCWEWNTDTKTRICNWTKVTTVAYHHTRTTCEAWYDTRVAGTWEYTTWASGRKTSDFAYATENCSIKQIDSDRPEGEVEQIDE